MTMEPYKSLVIRQRPNMIKDAKFLKGKLGYPCIPNQTRRKDYQPVTHNAKTNIHDLLFCFKNYGIGPCKKCITLISK